MKHMRKIFALALALIMVMGLATTAFATEGEGGDNTSETYSITITDSLDGATVAGHIYNVYQIYTGTLTKEGNTIVLTDLIYGQNYGTKDAVVPLEEVRALENRDGAVVAKELLKNVVNKANPVAVLNDINGFVASGLLPGYYLVEDVTPAADLPEYETSSALILKVVETIVVKSKHTAGPIVEKKIDDTNNSKEATNNIVWHDSADHDIFDAIPFMLKMTVPEAFQLFKTNNVDYPFTFHDTEEQGLTFNEITSVYVLNGNTKTPLTLGTDYTLENPANDKAEEGHTFDVVFADLTDIASVQVGSEIIVEYTSILNENAILGSKGNVNEVFGEFRNYYEPTVPVYTPKDAVIAFTYKVVINKVDEDGEALPGATFTLEKFVASANGTVEYPKDSGIMGNWVAKETVETNPDTVFTFKGLDDGYYRLTETDAPDGYNKIDPIEFEVTADHDILWETQGRLEVLNTLTGNKVVGEIEFTPIQDKNAEGKVVSDNVGLSADVENKTGVTLPETGGIGTTIFYIVGGMLAVAAVVLLITKKRMASAE